MKEAIGGLSLFQIVIVFLLIFTGVMCLTINHSKAFGVKDEIINIIENDKIGTYKNKTYKLNDDTIKKISEYLNTVGYRTTGSCPSTSWVGYDRNGNEVSNNKAAFCLRSVDVSSAYYQDILDKCKGGKCNTTSGDFPTMIYYDVMLFYQLDIPVINSIMNFKLEGSTKVLFG